MIEKLSGGLTFGGPNFHIGGLMPYVLELFLNTTCAYEFWVLNLYPPLSQAVGVMKNNRFALSGRASSTLLALHR